MGGRHRRRRARAFLSVLAAGLLLSGGIPACILNQLSAEAAEESGRVVEVVDGDTLRVRTGTGVRTVRLIGIDAPERSHPSKPKGFLADEAAAHLSSLCDGKIVELKAGREESDRHGRLLRYVFLPPPDGRLLNREMVRQGYARILRRYPFSRRVEFEAAEAEARKEGSGIWREGGMARKRWVRERRDSGADVPQRPDRSRLPAGVVSWEEAHFHVGREMVVLGKLVRTHRGKGILHLNFHPDWRKYVSVVIKEKDFRRFPEDPETLYGGKTVKVRGKVVLFKGRPEIVVRDPEAISVVE